MRILFTIILTALMIGGNAQGLGEFKIKLQTPDAATGTKVEVREHGDAAEIIRALSASSRMSKVRGYRVTIFSDNSQNARAISADIESRFNQMFPGVASYRIYEEPYYRVTVGNCLNSEEAIVLCGIVKGTFDKAVSRSEEIPLSALGAYVFPKKSEEIAPEIK